MRRLVAGIVAGLAWALACGGGGGSGDPGNAQDVAVPTDDPGTGADPGTAPDGREDVVGTELPADDPGSGEDGGIRDGTAADQGPPVSCRTPAGWQPGRRAFTDVTEASGLKAMGVVGVRLNAVDWDGDGRPDLVVRGYDSRRDDLQGNTVRNTFLLRNNGDGTFSDRTAASGFLATRDGAGGRVVQAVVWGDLDNDGDLDAVTALSEDTDPSKPESPDQNEVMWNQGDGTFALAEGGDFRGQADRWPVLGLALLDYDRDGFLDVFMGLSGGPYGPMGDRLFRGDGQGRFLDRTQGSGLDTTVDWSLSYFVETGRGHRYTYGVTACDLNGDGRTDLISSAYGRYFNAYWQATADGRFEDRSAESGLADDGRRDWTTNLNAQCYCRLVPDGEECQGVPAPPSYFRCTSTSGLRWDHAEDRKPYRLGGNHFTHVCGDIDNDGDLDLLDLTIVHWDVGDSSDPTELIRNDGQAAVTFDRPGNAATGLLRTHARIDWNDGDMTGALFDFDNDGRLDVLIASSDYPGTRVWLFHQKADGTFEEVPVADGLDHPRAHGVAVADFDGDGDLDVALGHGRARCGQDLTDRCYPTQEVHLFRNDVGQEANAIRVLLVGTGGSNRAAIGARVRVTAGGVTQTREVSGGYGHEGIQHELALTFGLGGLCEVDRVEVRWPDAAGTTEVWTGLSANTIVRLTQGQPGAEVLGVLEATPTP